MESLKLKTAKRIKAITAEMRLPTTDELRRAYLTGALMVASDFLAALVAGEEEAS